MRRLAWLFALLLAPAALPAQSDAAFPHSRHARLFPLCSGCHAGITSGDAARELPSPALCATCHDGAIKPRVSWAPPARRARGLLVFSHQQHSAKAPKAACESCHAPGNETRWMNVSRAEPLRCASCHAHGTTAHLDERTVCATCHRTLASATDLSDANVAALPQPPSHSRPDFASTHGASARSAGATCATCHARESCLRCHVDGARQPTIIALATDARVARLAAGRPASYPTPADHRDYRFVVMHGGAARTNVARCATCHTRTSCESCHTGTGARDVLRQLPRADDASAPGVRFRPARTDQLIETTSSSRAAQPLVAAAVPQTRRPDTALHTVRVHPPGFARSHGPAAASGVQQCANCHAQKLCASCHAGERVTRRYHVPNFVATHAPQAYARETDCSSCHSTEAFCRDCHRQTGLASQGGTRSLVFHNAQPLWLLQHGRAARQDLKSCATCHQQSYCMQCHSDRGSRVNPHGPDFDAARMQGKNPAICLYCHLSNPLAR